MLSCSFLAGGSGPQYYGAGAAATARGHGETTEQGNQAAAHGAIAHPH